VAKIVHVAFYFMMILIPFLGWWVSSAAKTLHPINVLGWHAPFLPVMRGREFAGGIMEMHRFLGFTMAALLLLHIGAALKHRFIDRDGVLGRMSLPPAKRRRRLRGRGFAAPAKQGKHRCLDYEPEPRSRPCWPSRPSAAGRNRRRRSAMRQPCC
jgi:hypothetical protein